eukprot:Hpha_TRINITY_DN2899_c0_g1::TRINITY_DN2899_c0_g1_i1::g.171433::m.171433
MEIIIPESQAGGRQSPTGSGAGSRRWSPKSRRSSVHSLVKSHAESTMIKAEQEAMHKASIFSCSANLANSIIGAGILGLPHAIGEMGYVLGSLTMMLACMAATFTLHLLACCAHKHIENDEPSSFYSVAMAALPSWALIVDAALVINCFFNGATYLIVIGDQLPAVVDYFGGSHGLQDRRIWICVGFAVVVPLAIQPRLDALRFTSTLSVVIVAFLALMVVLFFFKPDGFDPCEDLKDDNGIDVNHSVCENDSHDWSYFNFHKEALKALTVFIFCFTCHQNIFSVCNEMREPSLRRYNIAVGSAQLTAFAFYLCVAICALHTYGAGINEDMLKSYPSKVIVSVARICVSLLVSFAYPLQAHPARRSALSLWEQYAMWKQKHEWEEEKNQLLEEGLNDGGLPAGSYVGGEPTSEKKVLFRYWVITVLYLIGTLGVAVSLKSLGAAMAISGGTASTLVSFIMPGICYYRLFPEPHFKRTMAYFMFIMGCAIVPASLVIVFTID